MSLLNFASPTSVGRLKSPIALFAFASIASPFSALAFDVRTHSAMTSEAVAESTVGRDVNSSSAIRRLGLVDFPRSMSGRFPAFGKQYIDLGTTLRSRNALPAESEIMKVVRDAYASYLGLPHELSMTGWLIRGAIREDDNRLESPGVDGDEPGGVFNRVFGHFFDPVVNRGLTIAGVQAGARASDWALQPGATVTSLPTSFAGRENHYKTLDAREAMWRALTLKTSGMGDAVFPDGWATDALGKENLRKAYWATMFRALGDVVHLVQDMAQPQHTRNDAHSGVGCVPGLGCAFGHDSYFEKHLRARTVGEREVVIKEGLGLIVPDVTTRIDIVPKTLDYSPYPKPVFNSYSEFFATGTGSANSAGQGLANYSNRGFYSAGTIIGTGAGANYPSPSPSGSGLSYSTVVPPELKDSAGNPLPAGSSMILRKGNVSDTLRGTPDNDIPLAAVGAWDQFLLQKNPGWSSHTLNHINYDAMAKLLIPRAVAYSAGLIDYFFRGEIFIGAPAEGVVALIDQADAGPNCPNCGFKKVKVNVANKTPPVTPPGQGAQQQAMTGGKVVAVAKFRRNTCYDAALSQEYIVGAGGQSDSYYDGCVGLGAEEIVVSEAQTVPNLPLCDAGISGDCESKGLRMVFDFHDPIPIGSADIKLQVVYRGWLGAEADAVVVETLDLSEPSYYTFINATDYIKLGGSVYTREQIVVSPDLLQEVRSDCVLNGELRDSCLQPRMISFPLGVGVPPPAPSIGPNAVLNLAPREFARVAYLIPMTGTASFSHDSSGCFPGNATQVEGRKFQVDFLPVAGSPGVLEERKTVIKLPAPVRAVRSWEMVTCIENGKADGGDQPDNRTEVMAPLSSPGSPKPISEFSFGS